MNNETENSLEIKFLVCREVKWVEEERCYNSPWGTVMDVAAWRCKI